MPQNFFEVSRNSYSIAAIFGEVLGHSSQHKIIGLVQRFLKESNRIIKNKKLLSQHHHDKKPS